MLETDAPLDTLVALLKVHGPCSVDRLAELAGRRATITYRRLHSLWIDDLVHGNLAGLWRLTDGGHERAAQLQGDEQRFAWLTRARP